MDKTQAVDKSIARMILCEMERDDNFVTMHPHVQIEEKQLFPVIISGEYKTSQFSVKITLDESKFPIAVPQNQEVIDSMVFDCVKKIKDGINQDVIYLIDNASRKELQ